jgi:regulator of sigma E protease
MIVLGLVVFVHELGHFWAARWAGVKVEVFSIGWGRPIFKWKDKKGTEWRVAWLPLGGFVRIYGQDDMFDRRKYQNLPAKEKIGHYLSAPAWKQAVFTAGGALMNLALAWVIYAGLFMRPQIVQLPVIGQIEQTAKNLKTGDRIMQVNGKNITSWQEMLIEKELNVGNDIRLVVLRGERLVRIKMPTGKWGISQDMGKTEIVRYGFFGAIGRATTELWTQSKMIFVILKQIITGERSGKQLGGFIYIAEISGKALSAGIIALMLFIALLSVNLGIINLLPLPVLDGGYLLILLIEGVARRKMQGKWVDWIMRAGWLLLLALIAFTIWNDIFRLVSK